MIPGNKHGICKLCEEEKQLCESHIIPELCHKEIYDDKHRAIEGKFQNGELRKRTLQKGKREYLLCSECESFLNDKYEKSFKEYWYGSDGLPERINGDHIVLQNADCHKFKLFHLSIIWRASVSTEFSSINLGAYYNKAIRKILLNESPIPQGHYPIIGCVLTDDEGKVWHQVGIGASCRDEGSRSHILSYAGCDWKVMITNHPTRKQMDLDSFILENDKIMLISEHFTRAPVCRGIIKKMQGIKKGARA
jgi:hypothetical protein